MISEMNLLICRQFFPFIIKFWYQDLNIIHMKWLHDLSAVRTWLIYVKMNISKEKNRTKLFKKSKKDSVLLCLQIISQVKTWKLPLRPLKDLVHSTEGPQVDNGGVHVSHSYYSCFFTKRTTSQIPVPPNRAYCWIKASLFFLSSCWYQAVTSM